MSGFSTTKLSSKGQVVIPEEIRKKLHLKNGDQFIVMGKDDVVILKTITPPSIKEFDSFIHDIRKEVRKAGIKREDVVKAIKKVRETR